MTNMNISLSECENRRLYRINSRNLSFGVFNSVNSGFVGIRTKFGDRYAFTEFHWDTGEPFGTVNPKEALDEFLPEDISIKEYLGTVDENTNRPVRWEMDDPGPRGKWFFVDTGEQSDKIRPIAVENKELFDWLIEMEKKYASGQSIDDGMTEDERSWIG